MFSTFLSRFTMYVVKATSDLLQLINANLLLWLFFKANTFQTVLMTDGQHTFSLFNYPENGIEWSTPTGGYVIINALSG